MDVNVYADDTIKCNAQTIYLIFVEAGYIRQHTLIRLSCYRIV